MLGKLSNLLVARAAFTEACRQRPKSRILFRLDLKVRVEGQLTFNTSALIPEAATVRSLLDKDGIEEVVIVGAMSHMCIDGAARAAADFGYRVTVIEDACATRDLDFKGNPVPAAEAHAAFMAALGFAYANVVSTDDYLAAPKT